MKKLLLLFLICSSFSGLTAQKDPDLLSNFNKVNSPVLSLSYSPDGLNLLAGYNDGSGRMIHIENESYISTYSGHWKGIQAIEMANTGKFVMTAGENTVKIWTPEGKELKTFSDHTTTIWSAEIDSSGKFVVAGAFNKTFKLMNVLEGGKAEDMRGHSDVAMTVCFNRGGTKIASASGNQEIWIWDFASRKVEMKLNGPAEDVYCLDFSPDGKLLASGSKDKTIRIYELKEGKLLYILKGHTNHVIDVEFHPDGQHLLSCSFDQSIRLWEIPTARTIYSYIDHKDAVLDIAFSPDGNTFASASNDKTIKIWKYSTDLFVDYYYSSQVKLEMEGETEFLPRQKNEEKNIYDARLAKAEAMKKEIYEKYYNKYLEDLKNGTLPSH
jgi:WD40 repeat protein